MDWLREHLTSRLDRLFVVLGALCLPLALALSRAKSYTVVDQFGRHVQTRAHPTYGSFLEIFFTLLLVVAGVRAMIFAVGWVARGSSRR
jgi:hypothetical protein